MTTRSAETATHCAYCGHPISGAADAPARFGDRFCSDAHADEFVTGVRAARMEAAARSENGACAVTTPGRASWRDSLKRGLCWGAPLLLLLAIPLFWSRGWAAAGGLLLTVAALIACPLAMYFMMRGMMNMNQQSGPEAQRGARDKGDRHA